MGHVDTRHRDQAADAFLEDWVDHELWDSFEFSQTSRISMQIDHSWGVRANPECVTLDTLLVTLVKIGQVSKLAPPPEIPLLMHYDAVCGWQLLGFHGEKGMTPSWR